MDRKAYMKAWGEKNKAKIKAYREKAKNPPIQTEAVMIGYRRSEINKKFRCICCQKKVRLGNFKKHRETKKYSKFVVEFKNVVKKISS